MVKSDGWPRRSTQICMGVLLVIGVTVAGGVGMSSASAAAVTGPTLTFSNSATQSSLGAAYSLALTNLLDTNTVTENPATFEATTSLTVLPTITSPMSTGAAYDFAAFMRPRMYGSSAR